MQRSTPRFIWLNSTTYREVTKIKANVNNTSLYINDEDSRLIQVSENSLYVISGA